MKATPQAELFLQLQEGLRASEVESMTEQEVWLSCCPVFVCFLKKVLFVFLLDSVFFHVFLMFFECVSCRHSINLCRN